MARIARVVVPGLPHHVTQRGNRRQKVFFAENDYRRYLALMAEHCAAAGVAVWAWCLMPNHVHLVLVPAAESGLRDALGRAHRRYTLAVNRRQRWSGYLWQGRFDSTVMDEPHALLAMRYVELNPVRARLCKRAEDWPWSSARAHLGLLDDPGADPLTDVGATAGLIDDWRAYLDNRTPRPALDRLRECCRTGRPFGSDAFVGEIEKAVDRRLRPARRGRPKQRQAAEREGKS